MLSRTVAALSLLAVGASAQNGTVYHILTNGADVAYLGVGVGAGGTQQAQDGLGTWVAGEDLRGSRVTKLGDFGFRISGFVEAVCVAAPPPVGTYGIKFPGVLFAEMSGLNPNVPAIFLNPACTVPSFPLGTSGLLPYGTGPASTFSFALLGIPTAAALQLGLPSGLLFLSPENGLLGGAGGIATLVGGGTGELTLPSASAGNCWSVQFTFGGSSLPLHDDIDGLWHWVRNSGDLNQYWQFSDNEQNIWQSQSVGTTGGLTAATAFPANADYALYLVSPEPSTLATLAPRAGVTPYSSWTANVSDEFGVVLHPNGGFDVGRGSAAISLSGTAGVPNPVTGVGNQNPSLAPGTVTTLGFATWEDNWPSSSLGSVRLTWLSVDLLGFTGGHPATDPGVVKFGGLVRVPVVSAGLLQPLTALGFQFFGHVTQPGFVHPFTSFFTPSSVGGASWQVPVPPLPAACTGTALNITYGTTGRLGTLGAPGPLTFDPDIAPPSTSRQLFLFD